MISTIYSCSPQGYIFSLFLRKKRWKVFRAPLENLEEQNNVGNI